MEADPPPVPRAPRGLCPHLGRPPRLTQMIFGSVRMARCESPVTVAGHSTSRLFRCWTYRPGKGREVRSSRQGLDVVGRSLHLCTASHQALRSCSTTPHATNLRLRTWILPPQLGGRFGLVARLSDHGCVAGTSWTHSGSRLCWWRPCRNRSHSWRSCHRASCMRSMPTVSGQYPRYRLD